MFMQDRFTTNTEHPMVDDLKDEAPASPAGAPSYSRDYFLTQGMVEARRMGVDRDDIDFKRALEARVDSRIRRSLDRSSFTVVNAAGDPMQGGLRALIAELVTEQDAARGPSSAELLEAKKAEGMYERL